MMQDQAARVQRKKNCGPFRVVLPSFLHRTMGMTIPPCWRGGDDGGLVACWIDGWRGRGGRPDRRRGRRGVTPPSSRSPSSHRHEMSDYSAEVDVVVAANMRSRGRLLVGSG